MNHLLVPATLALLVAAIPVPSAHSAVERAVFRSATGALKVEALSDELLHFELSPPSATVRASEAIYSTPQIARRAFKGPSRFSARGPRAETARLAVEVDSSSLCASIVDKARKALLQKVCPVVASEARSALRIVSPLTRDLYGLGEQFSADRPGADGNWMGQARVPGSPLGNSMTGFEGGFVGNAQLPALFAAEAAAPGARHGYALFVDHLYPQAWSFKSEPWTLETSGGALRWYFIAGGGLKELRSRYLDLVGRPLVPPKKAFGLWVSEYGYESWDELESKLSGLRAKGFPVDGFVLDLQWFGGIADGSEKLSRMGALSFDEKAFPEPAARIAKLRDESGIGLIAIEESYVNRALPEHAWLEERGYLARRNASEKAAYFVNRDTWWGAGGMIDWTNPEGADAWHDLKRAKLADLGILGHWTDLGEPENFRSKDVPELPTYHGFPELGLHAHADVHNAYNLRWAESIFRGYRRTHPQRRPFILTRSGAAGIQRFGAAMWSGDIGSNLASLSAHLNVHLQMSFSGVDYFGSDIGGFYRKALDGDLGELYTRWLAHGSLLEVPVRPHVFNLENAHETSPDRVGDVASNLANLRLRYELIPYYYSLAHRAHLAGEPVFPPLAYAFEDDAEARRIGSQRMIGPSLMFAASTRYGERQRSVYLPKGEWIGYHDHVRHRSRGEWLPDQPVYRDGLLRLPLYARSGAILPKAPVDASTLNAVGKRRRGEPSSELVVRVYPDATPSSFDLYEDDGESTAYLRGAVGVTTLSQAADEREAVVTIGARRGGFPRAPGERPTRIELAAPLAEVRKVTLDGVALPRLESLAELENGAEGWVRVSAGLVVARSGSLSCRTEHSFRFER